MVEKAGKKTVRVPPLNFAVVENDIYRSGHPVPINFEFLKTLNLKSVIYIGDKEDNYDYYQFLEEEGIQFNYIHMESATEPFIMNDPNAILQALKILVDIDNYPILVHSNKGKHRVGVLVGIMRKLLQGWSITGIFNEYDRYSGGKGDEDLEFIECFNANLIVDEDKLPKFVRKD